MSVIDLYWRRLEALLSPESRKIVRSLQPSFGRRILTSQLVPGWLRNQQTEQKDKPVEVVDFPDKRR